MEQGERTDLLTVHKYSGFPKNIWSIAGQATKNIASAQEMEMYKKIVERFRNNNSTSSYAAGFDMPSALGTGDNILSHCSSFICV